MTTQLDLTALVQNLETLTTVVENTDGTFTYTDEDGGTTVIDVTNLETLTTIALNADNTNIDYVDEDGVTTQLDLTALVQNLETLTTVVENTDGTFTYTDEDGGTTVIDVSNLETLTTITQEIGNTDAEVTSGDANTIASYVNEDGVTTTINETVTSLAFDEISNELEYTDENGATTVADLSSVVHSGTEGSVFFAGASGSPTEDNAQLFWDDTNNRLGIGTTTPDSKLQVIGTIRSQGVSNSDGTIGLPSYRFSNDGNTGLYRPSADVLGVVTGGVEAMRSTTTGGLTTVTINETLDLDGPLLDETDAAGTVGQILTATATGTLWADSPDDTVTTITQSTGNADADVTAGDAATIATYTNEAGTAVTINETVTTFEGQTDGTFIYTNEAGTSETIDPRGTWLSDDDDLPATQSDTVIYKDGDVGIGDFSGATTVDANLHVDGLGLIARFGRSANTFLDLTTAGDDLRFSSESAGNDSQMVFRRDGKTTSENIFKETGQVQHKAYGRDNADVQPTASSQPVVGIAADDAGNFIEVPTIFAAGKAGSTGGGSNFNATVTRNGLGDYTVSWTEDIGTNYIIQLSQPGRAGAGNDDPGISYNTQTGTSFNVIIGDNDNGGSDRARFDSEFMFTVIRMPGF